jgi:tRNA (cmo5U34)-methyltransferase
MDKYDPKPGQKTDNLYAKSRKVVPPFEFNQQVATVFQDMISRSVPGYALALDLIGLATAEHSQESTNCYDLGCSLGASALKIQQHAARGCKVIAIDNSAAMIEKCKQQLTQLGLADQIELQCQDINETPISNASVVVLNYTLQFIEKSARAPLLSKIYHGMRNQGVLILSEKTTHSSPEIQELLNTLHLNFKRQQGYSELEIAQKRSSLEKVLIAEHEKEHIHRIKSVGFTQVSVINKALNFTTFMGVKA